MAESPIVTLLTDFGQRDPFVGIMKGVVLSYCRHASLVDLLHEVPAYSVLGASLQLSAAVGFFPAGTIHLVVVDPGVGGIRRPIVAQVGGQWFVAPDNGVLSHVLIAAAAWRAWAVTEPAFARNPASVTFHGRDVFAPVAGMLAAGSLPESFGPEVTDPMILPLPCVVSSRDRVCGEVVWIDHFGNCLTNIGRSDLEALAERTCAVPEVLVGRHRIPRIVSRFEEASGEVGGALIGSTQHLELFRDRGNLAADWRIVPGMKVVVVGPREAPGGEGGGE